MGSRTEQPQKNIHIDPSGVERNSAVPLYVQVASLIRESLLEKDRSGDCLPSTLELAKLFGVSHKTIENAMLLLVEENLVTRIRHRGTVPVSALKVLDRRAGKCSIGFVCPGSGYDFWQPMLKAMQEQSALCGYSLDLYLYKWDDLSDEERALKKAWRNCSGVILYPNSMGTDRELILSGSSRSLPLLLFLLYFEDFPSGIVTSNSFLAGYELTQCLIRRKNARIAFIHDKQHLITPHLRLEGFRKAMREHNLPDDLVMNSDIHFPWKQYFRENQVEAIICSDLSMVRKFSAFFPGGKMGVFASPWQENLIPDGVYCAFNQPEELGKCAVDEIIGQIRDPHRARRKIQVHHIIRKKGE